MKKSVFEEFSMLQPDCEGMFFSQLQFRKKHLPEVKVNLCSGLVRMWYLCGKSGVDFFKSLKNPNAEFLKRLLEFQELSYYPIKISESSFLNLNQKDKKLLSKKYHTYEYSQLQKLLDDHRLSSLLELDLLKDFEAEYIKLKVLPNQGELIVKNLVNGEKPRLVIVIFRYHRAKNGNLRRHSHRIGFQLTDYGQYIYFDPNAGQVKTQNREVFLKWFEQYWEHSNYKSRLSIEGVPFCSIYELT